MDMERGGVVISQDDVIKKLVRLLVDHADCDIDDDTCLLIEDMEELIAALKERR